MENNGENSGPLWSLPVDRLTATDCNSDRSCQLYLEPSMKLGGYQKLKSNLELNVKLNLKLNVELNLKSNITLILNVKLNLKLTLTFVWLVHLR